MTIIHVHLHQTAMSTARATNADQTVMHAARTVNRNRKQVDVDLDCVSFKRLVDRYLIFIWIL